MKKHLYISFIFILLLLVLIADISFRHIEISRFQPKEWRFYILSIVYFIASTYLLLELLRQIKRPLISLAIIIPLTILFLFITIGSLIFYQYFNSLPNSFVFDYMFVEFKDSKGIFLSEITFMRSILFFLILCISVFVLYKLTSSLPKIKYQKIRIWLSSVFLLIFFFVLNNNVRIFPGCFIPPVNTFFSFTYALQKQLFSNGAGVHVLSQPYRSPLPKLKTVPKYNILVILGESSRAASSYAHGYSKITNPYQTAFLKNNNGLLFHKFFSVCTRTMLSFPSFLTGVSPSQSMGLLHRQPTLFNYAKSLDSVNTFLLSAQSYDWGNFRQFINDGSIDYLYDRENSGQVPRDAFSIQDSVLPSVLAKHLRSLKGPFVGMLQFFITHYPYDSYAKDQIFGNDSLSKYNASTHALDHQMGRIIDALKSLNLLDNTIILFTSDHGEAQNEHGYSGHLHTFYNEEAQVPAWIYIPDALTKNNNKLMQSYLAARANQNVTLSNIDVVPTVMELLGIWDDTRFNSFRKELTGSPVTLPVDTTRVIFMQNYNEVDYNTMFVGLGLLQGNHKYLLHTKHNRLTEELYDISSDPLEKNNLISHTPASQISFYHDQLMKYPSTKTLLMNYLNHKN